MRYSAKIIEDSVAYPDSLNPATRLTTMELVIPRIVLAEFNTHRAFSRNSASSRAIPISKQVERVMTHPFIPVFKKNQKGMQPAEPLSPAEQEVAVERWLAARSRAVEQCLLLSDLDVHKQWCNRLLEPFMWHTIVATGTNDAWENFFGLRCSPMAQDEIRIPAEMAEVVYRVGKPKVLGPGGLHLPYLSAEEMESDVWGLNMGESRQTVVREWKAISSARCARVSYLTQDGRRDFGEDLNLYDRLTSARPPHLSPLEHVAEVLPARSADVMHTLGVQVDFGNFGWPWLQHRKEIPGERVARRPTPDAK